MDLSKRVYVCIHVCAKMHMYVHASGGQRPPQSLHNLCVCRESLI